MHSNCIFCKIITKQFPTNFIHETKDVIVIADIAPKAPIHYLIISKKHIANIQSCTFDDQSLLGSILLTAQILSKNLGNKEFKLITNNGASVGQSVFHLHVHFLAGSGTFFEKSII